jgi:hypothetical protein
MFRYKLILTAYKRMYIHVSTIVQSFELINDGLYFYFQ